MKPDETVQEMESKLKVLDKRLARLQAEKRQLEQKLELSRNAQNRAMEQRIEATLPELKVRLFQAVGYQRAVEIATRGGSQIDLPRYGTETLKDFTCWLIANRESIGWAGEPPTPAQLESNPLRYVSSFLEHFELRQKRVGKSEARTYAIDLGDLQRVMGI